MAKPAFSILESTYFPNTQEEALANLVPERPMSFAVLDESFNETKKSGKCKYDTAEFLDALQKLNVMTPNFVIAILLNEPNPDSKDQMPQLDRILQYSEYDANFFINRPCTMGLFKDKATEIKLWLTTPPPWVQVVQNARKMMKENRFAEAVTALAPIYAKMPESISIGLLLVKAQISASPEEAAKAMVELLRLQGKDPKSTGPVRYYAQAAAASGDVAMAFEVALELLEKKFSDLGLQDAMGFAHRLLAIAPRFDAYRQILNALKHPSLAAKSAKLRLSALAEIVARAEQVEEVDACATLFQPHLELGADLRKSASTLMTYLADKRAQPDSEAYRKESEAAYMKVLRLNLDLEAGMREAIEPFVLLHMKHKKTDVAYEYLNATREKKYFSLEYYRALASLELMQGRMKEAYYALEQGRSLMGADDKKLQALTAIWQARNSSATK